MLDNSIGTILRLARERLKASSTPAVDSEILLQYVLGVSRTILITWPMRRLNEAQLADFETLLTRREAGEPIAYIIGRKHFWDLNLKITKDVLIPRPESELIVEWVLDRFDGAQPIKLADLGTGSGALAISIAKARPTWQVDASDIHNEALLIAKDNATFNEVESVSFFQGHWCDALPAEAYDIIVSNPPYIAPGDPHLLIGDVCFEPRDALVASHHGYEALFAILQQARQRLKPKGYVLLEHGYEQAKLLEEYAVSQGYKRVDLLKDLAGHERISIFLIS